jgi:hypothetical protein
MKVAALVARPNPCILLLCAFLALTSLLLAGNEASLAESSEWTDWLSFSAGADDNQLLWLKNEDGAVLDGPFQGPMAYLCDKNGNLWVGDTLNARILAFDKTGRPGKNIDLIAAAGAAGLASDPVLVDFAPGTDGRLLVADAANNAIIAVDIKTGSASCILPARHSGALWSQINRVHADCLGRIYVEDVATMKTYVLEKNGKPFCEPLDGEVGLAVSADGIMAMVVNDSLSADRRLVVLASAPGAPFEQIASLEAEEPVRPVAQFCGERSVHMLPPAMIFLLLNGQGLTAASSWFGPAGGCRFLC